MIAVEVRVIYMLCRNRIQNFARWKAIIDSYVGAHRAAGLHMRRMWRAVGDANNVFFLFEVESLDKARAFIGAPEAAEAGRDSGVIEGEYHFIEDVELGRE
jgi:hypothetical protein